MMSHWSTALGRAYAAAIASAAICLAGASEAYAAGDDAGAQRSGLELLATAEIANIDIFRTRGEAFLRAAAMHDSIQSLAEFVNSMRYANKTRGTSTAEPIKVFFLADTESNAVHRVTLIPVSDDGTGYISGISQDYEMVHKDGAITTAELPFDKALPALVFAASTGKAVIASDHIDSLHWLVERLRDRDLPRTNAAKAPLRATVSYGALAEYLKGATAGDDQLYGGGRLSALTALAESAIAMTNEISQVEISVTPSSSGLDLCIVARARGGSRLGVAAGMLRAPSPSRDIDIEGKVFMMKADTIPSLASMAQGEIRDWTTTLANAIPFLGCSIGPAEYGWFAEFLPMLAGERFEAMVEPPSIEGVVFVQVLQIRDHAAAAAKLSGLVAALREPGAFKGVVDDDIHEIGYVLHRIRPELNFTREENESVATSFNADAALSRLARLTTVEAAVIGTQLIVVHGPEGSLEALRPSIVSPARTGATQRRAGRLVPVGGAKDEAAGVAVFSLGNLLRTMVRLGPDAKGKDEVLRFSETSDGIGMALHATPGALRWNIRLNTAEMSLLNRIFSVSDSVIQDIIVKMTLEPLKERQKNKQQKEHILSTMPKEEEGR